MTTTISKRPNCRIGSKESGLVFSSRSSIDGTISLQSFHDGYRETAGSCIQSLYNRHRDFSQVFVTPTIRLPSFDRIGSTRLCLRFDAWHMGCLPPVISIRIVEDLESREDTMGANSFDWGCLCSTCHRLECRTIAHLCISVRPANRCKFHLISSPGTENVQVFHTELDCSAVTSPLLPISYHVERISYSRAPTTVRILCSPRAIIVPLQSFEDNQNVLWCNCI